MNRITHSSRRFVPRRAVAAVLTEASPRTVSGNVFRATLMASSDGGRTHSDARKFPRSSRKKKNLCCYRTSARRLLWGRIHSTTSRHAATTNSDSKHRCLSRTAAASRRQRVQVRKCCTVSASCPAMRFSSPAALLTRCTSPRMCCDCMRMVSTSRFTSAATDCC